MWLYGNRIVFEWKDLCLIVIFCIEIKNIGLNVKLLVYLNVIYLGN